MKRRVLCVAIASSMAVPGTAHAVKYKLSGQVNRAIVFMDDGQKSDVRRIGNINRLFGGQQCLHTGVGTCVRRSPAFANRL